MNKWTESFQGKLTAVSLGTKATKNWDSIDSASDMEARSLSFFRHNGLKPSHNKKDVNQTVEQKILETWIKEFKNEQC